MKRLHLVCNAHLDPYWQWEWEEGAAETISTFRTAADLCEEFGGFVFNHNEVILYKWVEEYEPALFQRIQRLVKEGKWHIMGGWYLQPDCNMPSGESFARQALLGNLYFEEKFGVKPTTAINFDPFGHSRGLVQILKKAGYDSYLHCRPFQNDAPLPSNTYTWVGFDGSEITAHRAETFYNSPLGKARNKVERYLEAHKDLEVGVVLWGVGNHGGGPSRQDLKALADLMQSDNGFPIEHSTPEAYFREIRERGVAAPRHEGDVNPWAVGCYTSMIRVKQLHRRIENEIYAVEKMASTAAIQGLMEYPKDDIHAALCDLMVAEFHDILPGSSIQPVEDAAIRLLDHGLEILSRLKARAFFSLASGQPKPPEGQIPIVAYNPHPFPITGVFECEFNLPDAHFEEQFTVPIVHRDGKPVPCQVEKEKSNLNLDWRKRVVFETTLEPAQVTRFNCTLEKVLPKRPEPQFKAEDGRIHFKTGDVEIVINGDTGLMDKYAVKGVDYLRQGAFQPLVMKDNEDPWDMLKKMYRDLDGKFTLMSPERGTAFSGVRQGTLPSVRVIEDGEVRTVVEALFEYSHSFIVITYRLPKRGSEVEVHVRVHWNEKDKCLKLALPTPFAGGSYLGEVAYGRDALPGAEREVVAHKYIAAVSKDGKHAVTLINDGVYGSDFPDGEIRMTLLRSPSYTGHPIHDRPIVMQDRYTERIDQGERQYLFWLNAGPAQERLEAAPREALAKNEKPFLLSFSPPGTGKKPAPGVLVRDDVVQMPVFKKAERGEGYIIRLFEPTGQARTTTLSIPAIGLEQEVKLGPFELKTFLIDPAAASLAEVNLLERPVKEPASTR